MKNKWCLVFLLLFIGPAYAGTSVGNFNSRTQSEFDFRIAYPNSWRLDALDPGSEKIRENWILTNEGEKISAENASSIQIQFLNHFPAKNVKELLTEISRIHPQETWNSILNPDIDGFVSEQKTLGEMKTKNLEYYFSKSGLVVRVTNVRNDFAQGAAQLQIILDTIRRPSKPARILQVTLDRPPSYIYHPDERACFTIQVDSAKADENLQLSNFKLKGSPDYIFSRQVEWDWPKSQFRVCQDLNRAFRQGGLWVSRIGIAWGTVMTNCEGTPTELKCNSYTNDTYTLPVNFSKFVNPLPDYDGPEVLKLAKTKSEGILLQTTDPSGVQVAKLSFKFGNADPKYLFFYPDELTESNFVKQVPRALLVPGFNLISEIQIFDKLGNVTQLNSVADSETYLITDNFGQQKPSMIPLLSIFGGRK